MKRIFISNPQLECASNCMQHITLYDRCTSDYNGNFLPVYFGLLMNLLLFYFIDYRNHLQKIVHDRHVLEQSSVKALIDKSKEK